MKYKCKNLKEIFSRLRNGEYLECNRVFMHMHRSERDGKEYIFWCSGGASAERATLQNLRWLLEHLAIGAACRFRVRTPEEYERETGLKFFYWGLY